MPLTEHVYIEDLDEQSYNENPWSFFQIAPYQIAYNNSEFERTL